MEPIVFVVNEEPYCLWERDVSSRNLEFLDGLDPGYAEYSLNAHLTTDDDKRASVALQISLHHTIETFFSLLGALIQAPDCAYAWIAKCTNSELRALVDRIRRSDPTIVTGLNVALVTWKSVAECVFAAYMPGTDRQVTTIEGFSQFWDALSRELTDPRRIEEYNSLKHGLRVRPGGFGIAVGREEARGVPAPASEMKLLGKSEFGCTFYKIETLKPEQKSRSVRSRRISVNWSIERTILLHQLTQMSIANVVSALRYVNGVPATKCQYLRPEDDKDFNRPWRYSPGVTATSFDAVVDERALRVFTKEELLVHIANSGR